VAEGIARVLAGAGENAGSYEFAGPGIYTYKELVSFILVIASLVVQGWTVGSATRLLGFARRG
jgi:hypothetical protein